jgi:hypothetical protein
MVGAWKQLIVQLGEIAPGRLDKAGVRIDGLGQSAVATKNLGVQFVNPTQELISLQARSLGMEDPNLVREVAHVSGQDLYLLRHMPEAIEQGLARVHSFPIGHFHPAEGQECR